MNYIWLLYSLDTCKKCLLLQFEFLSKHIRHWNSSQFYTAAIIFLTFQNQTRICYNWPLGYYKAEWLSWVTLSRWKFVHHISSSASSVKTFANLLKLTLSNYLEVCAFSPIPLTVFLLIWLGLWSFNFYKV